MKDLERKLANSQMNLNTIEACKIEKGIRIETGKVGRIGIDPLDAEI